MGDNVLSATRRVEDIQVLRAVAIGLVVWQHLGISGFVFRSLFPGYSIPFWIGVELFFVISGFVVTTSVLNRPLAPFGFLIRRFFRLMPALACFLVFSGAVCLLAWAALPSQGFAKERIAGSLRSFVLESVGILTGTLTITGQSKRLSHGAMWSLSVEFQFYLAYALLMLAFLRIAGVKFRDGVLVVAGGLYALFLVARLIGPYLGIELPPFIKYAVFFKFDFFLLGVIGAAAPRTLVVGARFRQGPIVAVLLLAFTLALIASVEPFKLEYSFSPILDGVVVPLAGACLLGVVLLASANCAVPGQGSGSYRFFVWIGELSYSIYLFHLPVFALFWLAVNTIHPAYFHYGDRGLLQMVICVPLTVVIAWFVYGHVERPAIKLGHRLADGRLGPRITCHNVTQTAEDVAEGRQN